MGKRFWLVGIGVILGLILVSVVGWTFIRPHAFHGTVIQSPDPAHDFSLLDSTGQTIHLSDFKGKLVLLYFGYTFCPDVCPASLYEVAGALKLLGSQADQVQLIMISVDPDRDTPEKLGAFVTHFDPRFLGAVGTQDEIAQVATFYGIFYQKHEGSPASGYLMDHTATLMVIDQKGHLKLVFPFGTPAREIADDLAYMLK